MSKTLAESCEIQYASIGSGRHTKLGCFLLAPTWKAEPLLSRLSGAAPRVAYEVDSQLFLPDDAFYNRFKDAFDLCNKTARVRSKTGPRESPAPRNNCPSLRHLYG
jgi:hypothetical protein